MYYILLNEVGNFRDKTTKERKNMMSCSTAYTPSGINSGWVEFENDELALENFNLEIVPEDEKGEENAPL